MRTARFTDLVRDHALEVGDGYRAKNDELGGDGPVFLRAAYLQDQGFVLRNPDRFNATAPRDFGPKVAEYNDVVVTTKGNSTGRVGRIREAEMGSIYSPHLSYWRSRDANRIDQTFLYYWSQSSEFKSQLGGMAGSTDMAPYLSLRDQLRLQISLPSIEQQVAIGKMLGSLDDKIDLNRRMNETLEAMARAIFKDWFVDFGPTRAKMEGRMPYLAPDLWKLFPTRLDHEGKPIGWQTKSLGSIAELNPPERLSRGTVAPYFDMAAIPVRGFCPDAPVLREAGSGARFRNGDTLLARITPCLENGKTAYVTCLRDNEVAWGSTEFIVIRTSPPIPAEFAYLLARDERFRAHAIQSMTGTSGRQRVQSETLSTFRLVRASDDVMKAFGTLVSKHFQKITSNASESETLSATRDLLLPKLMSGEIGVRDAEKMAAAA